MKKIKLNAEIKSILKRELECIVNNISKHDYGDFTINYTQSTIKLELVLSKHMKD